MKSRSKHNSDDHLRSVCDLSPAKVFWANKPLWPIKLLETALSVLSVEISFVKTKSQLRLNLKSENVFALRFEPALWIPPLEPISLTYLSDIRLSLSLFVKLAPGDSFTNRLKLSQLWLCVTLSPKRDLSLFVKLAPGIAPARRITFEHYHRIYL